MLNPGLMTSNSGEWETPQDLFDELDTEFGFTLDVCATAENAKCSKYFDIEQDALKVYWGGEICWMNPPYGRTIGKWVEQAYKISQFPVGLGALVVGLLPARTDTRWFHNYIYGKAEIRFIKGRIKFSGAKWNAPFPSMVVIWEPKPVDNH